MKKLSLATAAAVMAFASVSANAQSSVTLYGLVDAGIQYVNNAGGHSKVGFKSGNISGSRWGMKGAEDLGSGLKAIFTLESGFDVGNGTMGQSTANGTRIFGRQAFVGLQSNDYGTLTLGRQYATANDFVAPLSATSGSFGDSGFAHPYDNDNLQHTLRLNNSVKYMSNNYSGFKFGGIYGFSNDAGAFALARAYSVGAAYSNGPLNVGVDYFQTNGTNSKNTAGAIDPLELKSASLQSDVSRALTAGINYAFGPAVLGFVYSHSQYEDSTFLKGTSAHFDNFEVNAMYNINPAWKTGLAFTYTDASLGGVSGDASKPKWEQVGAISRYSLSKRTEVYAEAIYQHAGGKGNTAWTYNGGASTTQSQFSAALGMLTRF